MNTGSCVLHFVDKDTSTHMYPFVSVPWTATSKARYFVELNCRV
jgi:hypothetical protein